MLDISFKSNHKSRERRKMEPMNPSPHIPFPQSILEVVAYTRFLLEGDQKVILLVSTKFSSSGLYPYRSFLPTRYERSHFPIATPTKYIIKLVDFCQSHPWFHWHFLMWARLSKFLCLFVNSFFISFAYFSAGFLLLIFQKAFHIKEINSLSVI